MNKKIKNTYSSKLHIVIYSPLKFLRTYFTKQFYIKLKNASFS